MINHCRCCGRHFAGFLLKLLLPPLLPTLLSLILPLSLILRVTIVPRVFNSVDPVVVVLGLVEIVAIVPRRNFNPFDPIEY
ncbi:hypothetical protein DERP_006081 [Dermatophagoides pteronyssinus]|uniref:Uncharacterized protein n=1 Tax=Dermatophagoides pteronyssinus TaxID=6956 RepID=A0ABQ8JS93_DERPT|nr:hypothetical protein DERP_006081 [Dermatophagoides pteronyssinus]